MNYEFKNLNIERNFKEEKEYYYLGFTSIDYIVTKIVYSYLSIYNSYLEFCCDFNMVQRIIKKILSNEYYDQNVKGNRKYIYSYIGAIILDDTDAVESFVNEIFNIDNFLLTIFKKENNKYKLVNSYLTSAGLTSNTHISISNIIKCSLSIEEIGVRFNAEGRSIIEAKYNCMVEFANFLIKEKGFFDVNELLHNYNELNACEKLYELYSMGYIEEPNYFYLEHNEFEKTKYEVRCSVKGYNFFAVKINDDKDKAKNLSAFSMLDMISAQCNKIA